MVKIGKDLWAGIIIAITLLGCAFYLEMRHTKTADEAQKHEDKRTWQAVDSVKKAMADSLRIQLKPINEKLEFL